MPGRLEVICGPMFAGKTTELMKCLRECERADLRVLAFKPASDTRSGRATIRTHEGDVFDARALREPGEMLESIDAPGESVVGIDEAHFFGRDLIEPVRRLISLGARVIVAGVERDHRGHAFEPFPLLLCEADQVVKLTSICARCGAAAIHSQRMTPSEAPIMVGGAESYEARCRECFEPGQ